MGREGLQPLPLGPDRARWQEWDACGLIAQATERLPLLVEQGSADPFLESQLQPQALAAAAEAAGHPLTLRLQSGSDHSCFFIASFIASFINDHLDHLDQLDHHAAALLA
jgi:S-formylglutathione hydrolase